MSFRFFSNRPEIKKAKDDHRPWNDFLCVCVCRFLMASQLCVCRRNILGFDNDTQLSSCRFDPNDPTNKLCPIFDLYKIVELAGVDSYETIASLVIIP